LLADRVVNSTKEFRRKDAKVAAIERSGQRSIGTTALNGIRAARISCAPRESEIRGKIGSFLFLCGPLGMPNEVERQLRSSRLVGPTRRGHCHTRDQRAHRHRNKSPEAKGTERAERAERAQHQHQHQQPPALLNHEFLWRTINKRARWSVPPSA
jgi:hypothetical protein